jgi:hypothetical protein
MVGKPPDEADSQGAGRKAQDHLLTYIQMQDNPPGA